MPAKLPFRVSSIILLLFAIGHTAGFLSFRPAEPQALDVLNVMRTVAFNFGGNTVHWMDLYTGFGLALSVSGFVSAVLAWRLSSATGGEAGKHNDVASVRDPGGEHRFKFALLWADSGCILARGCGSSGVGRGAAKMKAIAHGGLRNSREKR